MPNFWRKLVRIAISRIQTKCVVVYDQTLTDYTCYILAHVLLARIGYVV